MPVNISAPSSFMASRPAQAFGEISSSIASGERVSSAADDAAGLAIISRFASQMSGNVQASRNVADAVSLTQVAEGGLTSIAENLQRIRELSLGAANGALNDQDRQALNAEAQQLGDEINSILESTNFNGTALFSDDAQLNFQVGPDAGDQLQLDSSGLSQALSDDGLFELDISTQQGASNAVAVIDQALERVSEDASQFGAIGQRLNASFDQLQSAGIAAAEAKSRIGDTDIAQAASDLAKTSFLEQADLALRAQANSDQKLVLQLLQP